MALSSVLFSPPCYASLWRIFLKDGETKTLDRNRASPFELNGLCEYCHFMQFPVNFFSFFSFSFLIIRLRATFCRCHFQDKYACSGVELQDLQVFECENGVDRIGKLPVF